MSTAFVLIGLPLDKLATAKSVKKPFTRYNEETGAPYQKILDVWEYTLGGQTFNSFIEIRAWLESHRLVLLGPDKEVPGKDQSINEFMSQFVVGRVIVTASVLGEVNWIQIESARNETYFTFSELFDTQGNAPQPAIVLQ